MIAAAQKDLQAFGALYDQYAPVIYRYLLSRLGNIDEARDVTSQTFLKAIEAFPQYTHRGYFSAWLFSIARSKVIDLIRHNKHRVESFQEKWVDPLSDPLAHALANERKEALLRCLRALKPEDQELLRLRYVADLSYAEIAELAKKNEDAVKKSVYRLLVRLQNQLED